MSIKVIDLAASKKRNDSTQKTILQRQSEAQKHFIFPNPGTPSLSDNSEFPSLSESLGRASNYLPTSGISLKYSDKLKSQTSFKNHNSTNIQVTSDSSISVTHQHNNKNLRLKIQSIDNKNKLGDNSKKTLPKQASDHLLNISASLNEISNTEKKELTKQKLVLKSKLNNQNQAVRSSGTDFDGTKISVKSNNQSRKSITAGNNNESKEENNAKQPTVTTKKKKRKSKIKRQVALQSGKITFLSPEVHSKILNQASTLNAQHSVKNTVIGNINDEEEYPELGKVALSMTQKENFLKKSIYSECQEAAAHKSVNSTVESNEVSENFNKESPVIITSEKTIYEKKDKNEKVHSHNPITISFYEMLLEKNIKQKKEVDEFKAKNPNVVGLSKLKHKKNASHPHNLLDSSSPAIKRGKEREKPKPKKPSQLKKIILLDRKARRETLLQMKNNCEEENAKNENELMPELHEEKNNPVTTENDDHYENIFTDDLPVFFEENEECIKTATQSTEITQTFLENRLSSEMVHLNISNEISSHNSLNDLSYNFEEITESCHFSEKSVTTLPLNEISKAEEDGSISQINCQSEIDTEVHLNVPQSPESLLNSLITDVKCDNSYKERAVKILLHTRNFREYCNHLISKDIDDVTYALLDDLARFQDRLHQKDPVKARMKKRMIYGVKEVKKYIKLRKLKCIIIAVDIENVETQGGLNDILNEIKVSAVDHHIPCIFALSRKVLGKVCRKPVPVSCVGIFNYEGSEANFKKMVELQSQSKTDYTEIFNKLLLKITDEEVTALIKAKKEAPETLRDVRANILSNFFLLSDSTKSEDEKIVLESNEDISNLYDNST